MTADSDTADGIAYELEVGGAVMQAEPPLVIDVIADLSPGGEEARTPIEERRFRELHPENFDDLLANWTPTLDIALGETDAPASVRLEFRSLADFEPDAIRQQVDTAPAVGRYIDEVVNNDRLRSLEGTLRGLQTLASRMTDCGRVRLRILSMTKDELAASLQAAGGLEESPLYREVYESNYGTFGGLPSGLIIADYTFSHAPGDVRVLQDLARLAAASMCVVSAGTSPRLFGAGDWPSLEGRPRLAFALTSKAHQPWRSLRRSAETRHLMMTAPRLRTTGNGLVTGGYAIAADLVDSVLAGSGMNMSGTSDQLGKAEVEFDEGERDAFEDSGLLLLGQATAVPPERLRTVRKPQRHFDEGRMLDSLNAGGLINLLWNLQFARAIKCMSRDSIGAFGDSAAMEAHLNQWLARYVSGEGRLLSEAGIRVKSLTGLLYNSGIHVVTLRIRPDLPGAMFARDATYQFQVLASQYD